MNKRNVPFLLACVLVALGSTTAAADRPIREIVDPMFWNGDPWEPDKAHVVPTVELADTSRQHAGMGPAVQVGVDVNRSSSWRGLVGRVLAALWRVSWPTR